MSYDEHLDSLRDSIQKVLDDAGDGWTLGHYVVVTGLEQMAGESIATGVWVITPGDQPGWMTRGLLDTALEVQQGSYLEED